MATVAERCWWSERQAACTKVEAKRKRARKGIELSGFSRLRRTYSPKWNYRVVSKQRAPHGWLRGLGSRTQVLLLDEPLSNLDRITSHVREGSRELQQKNRFDRSLRQPWSRRSACRVMIVYLLYVHESLGELLKKVSPSWTVWGARFKLYCRLLLATLNLIRTGRQSSHRRPHPRKVAVWCAGAVHVPQRGFSKGRVQFAVAQVLTDVIQTWPSIHRSITGHVQTKANY